MVAGETAARAWGRSGRRARHRQCGPGAAGGHGVISAGPELPPGHAKEARVAEARVPPPERGQAGGAEACGATPICCRTDAQADEAMKGVGCERPELKVEVAAGVREMGR